MRTLGEWTDGERDTCTAQQEDFEQHKDENVNSMEKTGKASLQRRHANKYVSALGYIHVCVCVYYINGYR